MNKYNPGDRVFVTVSNSFVRQAEVRSYSAGFYTIRFIERGGGTRVRESRLFPTREEAEKAIGGPKLKTGTERKNGHWRY
jgi:hypothetical protein